MSAEPEEEEEVPKKIYTFNQEGRLLDQDKNPFEFTNQADYEELCIQVTEDIYQIMTKPPYSLKKVNLHGSEKVTKADSFVFISENFDDAQKLVVLIHGSGAVQAGQWSRRLIINESLEIGSQLPYIRRCINHGWAILVMNTNDNSYKEEETGQKMEKEGSSSAIEHGRTVWMNFVIERSKAVEVAVIGHSFGGIVIQKILEMSCKYDDQLCRIRSICLTDAIFDAEVLGNLETDWKPLVRNWVCSERKLDEPLDEDEEDTNEWEMIHYSAGTTEHERSSAMAIDSVFKLINESFTS